MSTPTLRLKVQGYELLQRFHPPPGCYNAAHRGRGPGRRDQLFPAACRAPAPGRVSHHRRQRQPARCQPRHHGRHGRNPAGEGLGGHRRRDGNHVQLVVGQHPRDPAVRPEPRHQRGGTQRAGSHQRLTRTLTQRHAQQPDLPQGQPGRLSGDDPGADFRHPYTRADVRRGLHRSGAAPGAGQRHWPGVDWGRRAACGAG